MRATRKLLAALSATGFITCLFAWPGFVGAQESVDEVKVGAEFVDLADFMAIVHGV